MAEFKLPALPYAFDALEPYIDAKTMEIHYTKHHQAYVDKLNAALKEAPDFQNKSLEYLLTHLDALPEAIRTKVRDNGGGDYNHTLFWHMMKKNGGGEPKGMIAQEIKKKFGNFIAFKTLFTTASKEVFGSGWAWMCLDNQGEIRVITSKDQDAPILIDLKPLLGLDVWEHAYYLKYQNRRVDYIDAWWNVVNWEQVEENYLAAK